jgi:hypothetical protein
MGITDIVKTFITGDPLTGIKSLIEEFHLSPEQKAALEAQAAGWEIQKEQIVAARDKALDEVAGQNIRAETASTDKYTSRARPTFAYVIIAILAWNYIGLPLVQFCVGRTPQPVVLPDMIVYLFGAWMLGYAGFRSFDKFMALPGVTQLQMPGFKASNSQSPSE